LICIYLGILSLLIIENGIYDSDAQTNLDTKKKVENLSVNITVNPDTLSVSGSGNLSIKIENSGNLNASVNSIQLSPPWNQTDFGRNIPLNTNRTYFDLVPLKVPGGISSGKYNLNVKVSTLSRDYDASTVLTVNRIETLPLSDNIPLSILVLIFSGVLTYSVAAYIITHSFQRSYVEIGLWSAGLGFLNWGILSFLASILRVETTLELIQYDFYSVLSILLIGLAVGLIAGIFYKYVITSILSILRDKNFIREQERSFRQSGFWRSGEAEPVWPFFVLQEWNDIRQSLGKNYSTTLKVYLKNPVNSKSEITGILRIFEDKKPPYDMIIDPKYTANATSEEIIESLKKQPGDQYNLILDLFEKDSEYLKKVTKSMKEEIHIKGNTSYELANEILAKLQLSINNKDCDTFQKLLEKIDFSKYVASVLNRMQRAVSISYDGPIYIQGDNILNVELIRYESYEGIMLTDCSNKIIPKIYDKADFYKF